ncbi:helix-turn-helix domain-containing protein [Streptomyces sp. IBSBF 2806]|uniref:helix-turn-helix domain-containing protein n=1 Tax=Streptomyces sp. IBSBF 2806 TaxID=2903529 RepID=UPI002FDC4328
MSPLGLLAIALRNGRRDAGLSYAVLSDQTQFISPGTLQRAASGVVLPRLEVARAFAQVCGMDLDEVTRMWHAAYRGSLGGRSTVSTRPPQPRPDLVKDLTGLCTALEELRHVSGMPSFRMMEGRARASGKELSRSTAFRITAEKRAPKSTECLEAFLMACQVPPRGREVWFEAWLRAQRHAAAHDAGEREEMRQLESVVAGNPRGQVTQGTAVRMLRRAGFDTTERYRRFDAPWTVECLECAATFRIRLSDVVLARATCPECPKLTERVREAWAELVTNRSGLLSRQHVRALRAATVLQARMQRDHLDVPVFVADRTTLATLQSRAWHPAAEDALRRYVRRPFYLDILLVHDYDTMPSHRNGQRLRRLAKASGLVDSPLETSLPLPESDRGSGAAEDGAGSGRKTTTAQMTATRPDPGVKRPWKPTSNSGA